MKSSPLWIVVALALVSCSGGGDSTPQLNGVADLPSLDASGYDYSLDDAVQGLTKLSPNAQGSVVGGFSRAACEGYALKKRLFQDSRQIEGFRCYIKTLEEGNLGMTVPTDEWAYYAIHFPPKVGDEGPPENVRVRVGKFGTELKMDACIPGDAGYEREVEMRFSPVEGGYTGHAVNASRWKDDQEIEVQGRSRIDVSIAGTNAENFTSATFGTYHLDTQVANSDYGWRSMITFDATAATKSNSITGGNAGKNAQFGSNTSLLYGEWGNDPLVGSVQFSVSGEYKAPDLAQCKLWHPGVPDPDLAEFCVNWCYVDGVKTAPDVNDNCPMSNSGTESFSIVNNEPYPPTFTVIENADSPYFNAVAAAELPSLADIESHLGWTEDWDCTAVGSFKPVDATTMVTIKDRCEPPRDEGIWRMCEEQQRAAQNQ